MKRMPFERPTNYYDKRLLAVDEEICALLKRRKELSNENPGFPPDDAISNWANRYGLYEEYLYSLFSSMMDEGDFKPHVEPVGFRKHLPVFKSFENEETVYTVTTIRQYSNASVVYLYIDWDETNDIWHNVFGDISINLLIDSTYDCREEGGTGTEGHMCFNFVVSPPLPDDTSGLQLVFKAENTPFVEGQADVEFIIRLD